MKPILFNTEMVRAILEDRKTVTRRVVKPQPEITPIPTFGGSYRISMDKNLFVKPLYRTGDVLYVRETWARSMAGTYLYRATDTPLILDGWCCANGKPMGSIGRLRFCTTCDYMQERGILGNFGRERDCPHWQWRGPQREGGA